MEGCDLEPSAANNASGWKGNPVNLRDRLPLPRPVLKFTAPHLPFAYGFPVGSPEKASRAKVPGLPGFLGFPLP